MIMSPLPRAARATALMLAAVLAASASAMAQPVDDAKELEIVVEAPRSMPIVGERSPYTGAPVVVTTVRIPALYGDLDLARPEDAARLFKRLDRVANDACRQLDRLFPLNPDADCVNRAVAGATVTAKSLIAAAQKKTRSETGRNRRR